MCEPLGFGPGGCLEGVGDWLLSNQGAFETVEDVGTGLLYVDPIAWPLLISGCGGDDEELMGPEGSEGRPPQDPILPTSDDQDPNSGLEGDELLEGQADDELRPNYGLRFEATGFAFKGIDGLTSSSSASSTYQISRQSAFIPCSEVPDYMRDLVSGNNTVCFRATGRWASEPLLEETPVPVLLRKNGGSLCSSMYQSLYDGYNDYGYEIRETAARPEVLNFCSDELSSFDGEIGFIHAVTGIYNSRTDALYIDFPNTVVPADLDNPSSISAIALYSGEGYPTFGENGDVNNEGIINEGLYIGAAEDSVMTFQLGSNFSSDTVSLPVAGTDLGGSTIRGLSATLYVLGD